MRAEWWRSWHGAPHDPKWLVIARKAKTIPGIVNGLVWDLLDYASENKPRGSVHGFDIETYAVWSGVPEETITQVIAALRDKGVIDADERFAHWDERQPEREDSSASRTRAWRERQRANGHDHDPDPVPGDARVTDVALGDAPVTHRDASKQRVTLESESERDSESSSSRLDAPRAPAHEGTTTTTANFKEWGRGLLAALGEPEPEKVLDALLRKHHGQETWALSKLKHIADAHDPKAYYARLRSELRTPLNVAAVESRAAPQAFFVLEGSRAWQAWLRKRPRGIPTTQKGRERGWYFPTEYPPMAEAQACPDTGSISVPC